MVAAYVRLRRWCSTQVAGSSCPACVCIFMWLIQLHTYDFLHMNRQPLMVMFVSSKTIMHVLDLVEVVPLCMS